LGATRKNLDLPAVLFDLDGTLLDSVYEHVCAWSKVLSSADIVVPSWKIHRHVGMSGQSFVRELMREMGRSISTKQIKALEQKHDAEFFKCIARIEPLPGARELLRHLWRVKVKWAIATTGNRKQTQLLLKQLKIQASVALITGDDVEKAKPSPDAFVAAAEKLGVSIKDSVVVGDSSWDLLAGGRKGALGVGFLSGGYGQDELERAGAFRVYADAADMLIHIEDLGIPGG
jgi:HAD superfamily hydrolase (TIGR01509 family)